MQKMLSPSLRYTITGEAEFYANAGQVVVAITAQILCPPQKGVLYWVSVYDRYICSKLEKN